MASFERSLLFEPTPRGARLVALALLDDLVAARPRLDDAADAEALHDVRVAMRRLRSWMKLQGENLRGSRPRRARESLQRIAAASNRSRDIEVFSMWLATIIETATGGERSAGRWLVKHLTIEKEEADRTFREALERRFAKATTSLGERLRAYRTVVRIDAVESALPLSLATAELVRDHAARLRSFLDGVRNADDIRTAHRARIEGKRLRYLLEPFVPHLENGAALLARLKHFQDVFGGLHDAQVWGELLQQSLQTAVNAEGDALVQAAKRASRGKTTPRSRMPSHAGLVALVARVAQHAASRYAEVESEWLGENAGQLLAAVEEAASDLAAARRDDTEVERKYLLSAFPPTLPDGRLLVVRQGYVPGERLVERIREVTEGDEVRRYRTMKLGTGISRTEVEEETSDRIFTGLWQLTEGRRVDKRRHVIPDGDVEWEIDEFTDRDLVLAEIELSSPEQAVQLPEWLSPWIVREVTGEREYLNSTLAR